ncbi:uncharacterized protein LOC115430731 [Sphaeramia orbicularis]|uniref:uncharacterized protein LOC115430731 n=1 Tax=Sphaeramia orbicularis TaxID=375764 RepID=UPI00117EDE93|nr:uncharacterized protein LOC115430731 [Sphaeramia orbicularis]XP_030006776.1 uncharacterized protein LOC115430731 [Sphaeramia orbicularis]
MGPKAKGRKRKDVDEVTTQPEPQHQSKAESDHEEEEEESTRRQKNKYDYDPKTEQKLVQFFALNDCYYNKGSGKYANIKYKKKLLENLAKELQTSDVRITKWFTGQRSTFSKLLYKSRSGSKAKTLTPRQKWQLTNFSFLKEFIIPRTRTYDTGELPAVEEEHVDVEEDLEVGSTASSLRASTSENQGVSQVTKRAKESSTGSKMEDALLRFLERPRASESTATKMQEWGAGPLDEKRAFGQWFCAKMLKVPEDRWDEFEDEAHALLAKYTRQKPLASPHQPSQAQQSGLNWQQPPWSQPQQSQWTHVITQGVGANGHHYNQESESTQTKWIDVSEIKVVSL